MFFLKELPTREMMQAYGDSFPEMDVDAVEEALIMMRRASLLIRRLEAYFASCGLSQLRFLTLIVIDREPGREGLTAGEVADQLDVSRPVTTRTLQGLAEADLVAIKSNEGDRRSRLVTLTRKGKAKLASVLPGYYAEINDFMSWSSSDADLVQCSAPANISIGKF